MTKHSILSKESAQEKIHRMALEIAENISEDEGGLILIGIEKNGLAIAAKIKFFLEKYYPKAIDILSLSLNKDFPTEISLNKKVDFNNKNIILIDDVSNSGKTLLYALKPLLEYHPRRIQTLVMIERMHKLFPIKPDYVGLSLATTSQDHIRVIIEDGDLVGVTFE
ncbi:phosphoribosyltransferase family protein [Arachidicoccus sp.]|uniref:phosphoribosyltransferase family protein n=1 Tax=Arachidicoccus sp. TaxID=1872624 RepID=UPI003D1BADD7